MMLLNRMTIILVLLVLLTTCTVQSQYTDPLYMDSPTTCGTKRTVYDNQIVLASSKSVAASNPPTSCLVTIEAGYTDSYYSLEIIQESISINDCTFVLNIYNGDGINSVPVKSISCSSKSTGVLYTKGRTATFHLRQPSILHQTQNSFVLRIKAFRDPNAPDVVEGVSHIPVGAIIGIVIGVVVLIAFIILLCWCYRNDKLPGMEGIKYSSKQKNSVRRGNSESGTVNSAFNSDKKSSPTSTQRAFGLKNQEIWDSMTSISRGSKARTIDSVSVDTESQNGLLTSTGGRGYNNNTRTVSEIQGNAPVFPGRIKGRSQFTSFKESQENQKDPLQNGTSQGARSRNSPSAKRHNSEGHNYSEGDSVYENEPFARQLNRSPTRDRRNRDETELKRAASEPEDDHYNSISEDEPKKTGSTGMLEELRNEIQRRKSLKEAENKSVVQEKSQKQQDPSKETTFGVEEAPGGPPQNTSPAEKVKTLLPEEFGNLDSLGKYTSMDQQSEIGDVDTIQNPLLRGTNSAIRSSVSELRPKGSGESPRTKKKRKKKSTKKSVGGDSFPRRHKNAPGMETDTDFPGNETETNPMDYPSASDIPLSSLPLPPEALAPVFATDESVMQHYYPQQTDPYNGYQQPQIIGYDAYNNPVYGYPNQPSGFVPPGYAQTGQPAFYVQQTPEGPITQAAFQTPPQHMGGHHQPQGSYDYYQGVPLTDVSSPGLPGYTSTPSNFDPSHNKRQSPRHRRKSRSKSYNQQPPGTIATIPGGPSPMVGTVLDDPSLPPPGMTMVRSGVDPYTGAKTNQVLWSDANRDPTDPVGVDNPQITRKTMVRVTTKGTDDGALPDAPNPALQEMSFNAAQQLKAGGEPAFLSPSKSQTPARSNVFSAPPPLYASETPERENAGFYTGIQAPHNTANLPGAPSEPRVHTAPQHNTLIKDKITLSYEDESEI